MGQGNVKQSEPLEPTVENLMEALEISRIEAEFIVAVGSGELPGDLDERDDEPDEQ